MFGSLSKSKIAFRAPFFFSGRCELGVVMEDRSRKTNFAVQHLSPFPPSSNNAIDLSSFTPYFYNPSLLIRQIPFFRYGLRRKYIAARPPSISSNLRRFGDLSPPEMEPGDLRISRVSGAFILGNGTCRGKRDKEWESISPSSSSPPPSSGVIMTLRPPNNIRFCSSALYALSVLPFVFMN